ncbi:MAG: lactate utilization protein [Desulfobacula sp.]|nr:lactate utilization protein [Desulfobacula sp.]
MDKEQTLSIFKQKASLASAIVHEEGQIKEALNKAVALCLAKPFCENLMPKNNEPAEQKMIAAPNLNPQEYKILDDLCQQNDFLLINDDLRNHPGGLEMGITTINCGIAETGTLVLNSDSEETRLATMLCETHVAILKANDIYQTTQDAAQVLNDLLKQPSSYTAFITGASRTADIERVLTLGVHGPLELHIILIGE